jgi:hypothetical protein
MRFGRARGAVAHAQAARADRLEMGSAREHRDLVAGTREPGRDQTTDRTGAVDTDSHGVILD